MGINIALGIFSIVSFFSGLFALKNHNKNSGFLYNCAILTYIDIACIFLVQTHAIKTAKFVLLSYIILLPCFFYFLYRTIRDCSGVDVKSKISKSFNVFMIVFAVLLSVMAGLNLFGFNFISFTRKIMFGRVWWVGTATVKKFSLVSMYSYFLFCFIYTLCILGLSLRMFIKTPVLYRVKYIFFFVSCIGYSVMVFLIFYFTIPIWIPVLSTNILFVFIFYFIYIYSDNKLMSFAINSFANEMSDGLVIYNEHKDLIHINDLLLDVFDDSLVDSFKDISKVDEWMKNIETIENIPVIPYENEKKYYFSVTKHELLEKKFHLGTFYTFHDSTVAITQIKTMDDINAELERTSRMKSDFLANMSHELRTPMNAVIGLSEIALREELSPTVQDCLRQISNSGKNLLNIINDILDYSKIESGKMEIIKSEFEPLSEVNDISNILQTRIGDKDLEFFFTVDNRVPKLLHGDSMRIRQIIINLANNAIKFTKQGVVRVTATCDTIDENHVNLTFHVIDTGMGIKEEDMGKLFVSFQQVDSKRNRNIEGTGLGLAISKRLCEAMGGEIGVKSEYGKGSDFFFNVPIRVTNPEPALVVVDADKKRALVLNENDMMAEEFIKEMNNLGVEATQITSLDKYAPSEKQDFLFIEKNYYGDHINELLDKYENLTVVVLVSFTSNFKSDRNDLLVMKRPLTTLSMMLSLNRKTLGSMNFTREEKIIKFTAPKAKILIVDDNQINLKIAVGLLEPIKCQCYTAESGKKAIEMVKEEDFDLILMDHMMPDMDGIETTAEIRDKVPRADFTPIVALTANVVEGSRDMYVSAGMVDMIAKPIAVKDLFKKVYKWLPKNLCKEEGEFFEDSEDAQNFENGTSQDDELFDCLDCKEAIKSMGSVGLFRKIVSDYYRSGRDMRNTIIQEHDTQDWTNYAVHVHSLKSTSRSIGAPELGALAEKLEFASKALDIDEVNKYHYKAMSDYETLLNNLEKYFPDEVSTSNKGEATDEQVKAVFDKLKEACENLDMDGMDECVAEFKSYSYPDDKKDTIDQIVKAIENMDTEACQELMEQYG